MKNIIKATAISLAAALLLFSAYSIGRSFGIRHAIEDAEVFITSFEELRDPAADLTVYIDLDGEMYEHGCFIG